LAAVLELPEAGVVSVCSVIRLQLPTTVGVVGVGVGALSLLPQPEIKVKEAKISSSFFMPPNYYSRINSTAVLATTQVFGIALRTVYRAIDEMERAI
jgi:hypothetical protein